MCDVSQAFARPHSVSQTALLCAMWPVARIESNLMWRVWGQDIQATQRFMGMLPGFGDDDEDEEDGFS